MLWEVFSGYCGFVPSSATNISKFQFSQESQGTAFSILKLSIWLAEEARWSKPRTSVRLGFVVSIRGFSHSELPVIYQAFSFFFARHPSFHMLNKQDRSKSTNHSPLAWPFELMAHFHRNDMKQTLVCIVCDWLISNSTFKDDDDIERLPLCT